jgi:hypothetical protein
MLEYFLLEGFHEDCEGLGSLVDSSFKTDLVKHFVASLLSNSFEVIQVMVLLVKCVAFFDQLTEQEVKH